MNLDSGSFATKPRRHSRVKVRIAVDVQTSADTAAVRLSTEDISLGGCCMRTTLALEVGARVLMTLWLNREPLRTTAVVARGNSQAGTGFSFADMSADDVLKLGAFITAAGREAYAGAGGTNS